jgi:hypothetical protein
MRRCVYVVVEFRFGCWVVGVVVPGCSEFLEFAQRTNNKVGGFGGRKICDCWWIGQHLFFRLLILSQVFFKYVGNSDLGIDSLVAAFVALGFKLVLLGQ